MLQYTLVCLHVASDCPSLLIVVTSAPMSVFSAKAERFRLNFIIKRVLLVGKAESDHRLSCRSDVEIVHDGGIYIS